MLGGSSERGRVGVRSRIKGWEDAVRDVWE